eukprot:Sspe_Gene.47035::Locus_23717_Transcript_1_1_Confidence_1.000_Length_1091::g.47035::m.47035
MEPFDDDCPSSPSQMRDTHHSSVRRESQILGKGEVGIELVPLDDTEEAVGGDDLPFLDPDMRIGSFIIPMKTISQLAQPTKHVGFELVLPDAASPPSPSFSRAAVPAEPPPVHERSDFKWLILGGSFLALCSGYINVVALRETGKAITHLTGMTSRVGDRLVDGEGWVAGEFALYLVAYLFGAIVTACIVGSRKFVLGHRYGIVMVLVGLIFIAGVVVLDKTDKDVAGLVLWALASGMQNAMCTTFSTAIVRTTHVTGMVTDIGIVIGKWIRSHFIPTKKNLDLWKLRILTPIYLSFMGGGALGAVAYEGMGVHSAYVVA